jgi:hypothetical protein
MVGKLAPDVNSGLWLPFKAAVTLKPEGSGWA